MATVEFWTRIGPDRTVQIPAEYAGRVLEGEPARVVLLVGEGEDDERRRLRSEQLLRAHADEDGLYDDVELPRR